jgi:hypothetical protein
MLLTAKSDHALLDPVYSKTKHTFYLLFGWSLRYAMDTNAPQTDATYVSHEGSVLSWWSDKTLQHLYNTWQHFVVLGRLILTDEPRASLELYEMWDQYQATRQCDNAVRQGKFNVTNKCHMGYSLLQERTPTHLVKFPVPWTRRFIPMFTWIRHTTLSRVKLIQCALIIHTLTTSSHLRLILQAFPFLVARLICKHAPHLCAVLILAQYLVKSTNYYSLHYVVSPAYLSLPSS